MRAAANLADSPTSCLLSVHTRTCSLAHTVRIRARPLVDRFWPLVDRLPVCPRLPGLLPHRYSSRWIFIFFTICLSMMIVLSYMGPTHSGPAGWLAAWVAGDGSKRNVCNLVCPQRQAGDSTWQPRAIPLEHSCLSTAALPLPCSPNHTRSDIFRLRPFNFLSNYRNPCWYEPIPGSQQSYERDDSMTSNVYSSNRFSCFSRAAINMFHEMARENLVRGQTEQQPRRLRCLPYFYIAGMPKSGSTDLYRKVAQHPDIIRPPMKESHYWSKNRFGQRIYFSTYVPIHDYIDIFDHAALQIEGRPLHVDDVTFLDDNDDESDDYTSQEQRSGEAATSFHPAVTVDASASTLWNNDEWWRLPENCGHTEPLFTNVHYIRRLTPQARILVILRSPTERLYSDYLYFTKANKSVEGFHKDVLQSMEKLQNCMAQRTLRSCIYDKQVAGGKAKVRLRVGVYHVYLSEWLKVFPRDQVLVLRTEDYSKDVLRTIRHVYQFLGLPHESYTKRAQDAVGVIDTVDIAIKTKRTGPLTENEEEKVMKLPIANKRKLQDRQLGAMWDKTRQILQDFYQPHNELLAQLLNDDRFLWQDVTVASQSVNVTLHGPEGQQTRGSDGTQGGGAQGTGGDSEYGLPGDHVETADQGDALSSDGQETEKAGDDVNDDVSAGDGDEGKSQEDAGDFRDVVEDGDDGEEEEIGEDEEEDYDDSGYNYSDSGYENDYDKDEENFDDDEDS